MAETYFTLYEALFRCFIVDQKIDSIMSWAGFDVTFRRHVKSFIKRGTERDQKERLK